jgi:hypothetical protein
MWISPCQACRREAAVQEIENGEEGHPYRLCNGCAYRLNTLSLRPLEWVQLAAIHGSGKHELHDDFYTELGQACQPERRVRDADKFSYPKIDSIRDNLPTLLDLAMSLWFLEMRPDVIETLKQFPAEDILTELKRRDQEYRTDWVHAASLDICAVVLKEQAADWVRADNRSNVWKWVKAAANCLPFKEGFEQAIAMLSGDINAFYVPLLIDFHSSKTLDWLEENKHICTSYAHSSPWGQTAAYSGLTGNRVKQWLMDGPPLSWTALTAVSIIARYSGYSHPRAYLCKPELFEPCSWDDFDKELAAYEKHEGYAKVLRQIEMLRGSTEVRGLFLA